MKSQYKNLIVSGCSFTHEPDLGYPFSWANLLAYWTGMNIINLAIPGAGNDHISKSVILYLERNNLDPTETLILIMWSGAGRIDWITDKSLSNFKNEYSFAYSYDQYNELVVGGNWWGDKNPTHLKRTLIEYSKYQSDHSLALHSWIAIENLSNYLENNKFNYYYTSFLNYKRRNIKGDAMIVPFFEELKKLNLTLNLDKWLKFADNDYYGDWARENNFLAEDDFHPKYPDANEGWVKEILIPTLKDLKILYE